MKFNLKKYQKTKIINILKKEKFLLFSINANQNSKNLLTLEQNLSKLAIVSTNIYNNTAKKILKKSIFKNLKNLISSTFFFLKPKTTQKVLITSNITKELINITQFTVIGFKLNKRLWTLPQLKTITSFYYKKNTQIVYQFMTTFLIESIRHLS